MADRDVQISIEHPEASVKHIMRGIVRRGLKSVPPKASISLRVDADVLEWLKSQGPGYQTRINAILRAFKGGIGLTRRSSGRAGSCFRSGRALCRHAAQLDR